MLCRAVRENQIGMPRVSCDINRGGPLHLVVRAPLLTGDQQMVGSAQKAEDRKCCYSAEHTSRTVSCSPVWLCMAVCGKIRHAKLLKTVASLSGRNLGIR